MRNWSSDFISDGADDVKRIKKETTSTRVEGIRINRMNNRKKISDAMENFDFFR